MRTWHRSIAFLPVAILTAIVYALHQDFWFWRTARPLVFGFLPIGLFYHAVYTLACSALLWFIVRRHWPAHLEQAHVTPSAEAGTTGGTKAR
jgi:hypothetical protein